MYILLSCPFTSRFSLRAQLTRIFRASCSDQVVDHPVILDPNPTAAGSALLLPFHPENRLQADGLSVDALQVWRYGNR